MARVGTFIAVGTLLALVAGCDGAGPGPGAGPDVSSLDTRMPLKVDYNEHQIRHAPPHYSDGRVDPVESGTGRERNFGPEPADASDPAPVFDTGPIEKPITADKSAPRAPTTTPDKAPADGPRAPSGPVSLAIPPAGRGSLVAMLAAVRAAEPAGRGLLALAKPRKGHAKVAKTEAGHDESDDSARDNSARDDTTGRETGDAATETADTRGFDGDGGGYRMNFEDAEVKDVMQAVLGNVLGASYTIAPNVTGRITISSSAPQNRGELLGTLETALAMQGLSLTRNGSSYRVAPLMLGGGTLDRDGSVAGFGISVVPLRYTSVASMNKLLGGFIVGVRRHQASIPPATR